LFGVTFALTVSRALFAFVFALGLRRRSIAVIIGCVVALVVLFRLDVHRDDAGLRFSTAPGIRYRLAEAALHTASEHPLFGVGPGRNAGELPWPRPEDPMTTMDAHCTPINVAATLGLPALACFLGLCIFVLVRARDSSGLRAALALALAAVLFDSFTVDVEDFRHLWLLFALVAPRRQ
jgi:O-antigen ligase